MPALGGQSTPAVALLVAALPMLLTPTQPSAEAAPPDRAALVRADRMMQSRMEANHAPGAALAVVTPDRVATPAALDPRTARAAG